MSLIALVSTIAMLPKPEDAVLEEPSPPSCYQLALGGPLALVLLRPLLLRPPLVAQLLFRLQIAITQAKYKKRVEAWQRAEPITKLLSAKSLSLPLWVLGLLHRVLRPRGLQRTAFLLLETLHQVLPEQLLTL
jgi:hypothetical protein